MFASSYPSAKNAKIARRALESELLISAKRIATYFIKLDDQKSDVAKGALEALKIVEDAHSVDEKLGRYVRPELYSWYFDVRNALESTSTEALVSHIKRLPALLALPAAHALRRNANDITVRLPLTSGPVAIGELDCPSGHWPILNKAGVLLVDRQRIIIESGGTEIAEYFVKDIENHGYYEMAGCPISLCQSGLARRNAALKYTDDMRSAWSESDDIVIVPPKVIEQNDEWREYLHRYKAGCDEIQRVWPEAHAEMLSLCSFITLMKGVPFIGGSAISTFGTAYFNLLPEWSDMAFADHLIHEAAHQRLHVQFELEPALKNATERRGVSPIRKDQRSVEGILHATFVFLRLSQYFLRRREVLEESMESRARLHRHALGLKVGLESLKQVAKFTPAGQAFFRDLCVQAERIADAVGPPMPEFYLQIPIDYVKPVDPIDALQE